MVNNVCVIIRHPLADERFTLGLRNALATQMGGFETCLVFLGDGLFSLTGSIPAYLDQTLRSYLENEGKLYYLSEELGERKLTAGELSFPQAQGLDREELAEVLEDSDAISTF